MIKRCIASYFATFQQFKEIDAIPMKIEINFKEVTAEVLVENWRKIQLNSTPQSPKKASKHPLELPVEQKKITDHLIPG